MLGDQDRKKGSRWLGYCPVIQDNDDLLIQRTHLRQLLRRR